MSRTRTIKIAALNIAMHQPHSAERYVSMMKDAYAMRLMVRHGELHGAMLGSLHLEDKDNPVKGLVGEIYRFVKLDPNEPWFNTETGEVASNDDIGNIHIPGHLLPHLQRIPFYFKPDKHELWFISRDRKDTLGPQVARSIFQKIFDHLTILREYPTIEVTAIPDEENLERMLALPSLEKLVIEIKRPNADDGANEEMRVLKRLERQKAKRMTTELVAEKNESIAPDAETRSLAVVAARNGNVTVIGRNVAGIRVEESTEARPFIESVLVDPNIETAIDVLKRTAAHG